MLEQQPSNAQALSDEMIEQVRVGFNAMVVALHDYRERLKMLEKQVSTLQLQCSQQREQIQILTDK